MTSEEPRVGYPPTHPPACRSGPLFTVSQSFSIHSSVFAPLSPVSLLVYHSHLPCFSDAASYGVPPFLPRFRPPSHPPRHPPDSRRKLPIFCTGQHCRFSLVGTFKLAPWGHLCPRCCHFPLFSLCFTDTFQRNNIQRTNLLASMALTLDSMRKKRDFIKNSVGHDGTL